MEIYNTDESEMLGRLIYADSTLDQLKQAIEKAPDFWEEDLQGNDAPSQSMFLDFMEENPQFIAEVSRILIKVANDLDYTDNKTILDLNGNKIGAYGFGYEGVQIGLQESKSIENYFENIDTLEALKDRVDELYDEEKIDDDKYDEVIDYLDQRIEEVDNYIEARSKVTNTDERDIAGIIEDNTIDAIKTIGKMLNESKDLDKSNK